MQLPLLLASRLTPREQLLFSRPGLVIAVPPSQLALKATGLQEWDVMGWDGMLPQEAQEGTTAACLHKRGHEALKPHEDRPERCALEVR